MKKILVVFLAVALLLAGCSAAAQPETQTQNAATQAADLPATAFPEDMQSATPAADVTLPPDGSESSSGVQQGKGSIGKVDVEIVSAKADKTSDGKTAVVIELKWKNNTDKACAFKLALNVDVTQNGANCEPAELDSSSTVNTGAGNMEQDPGKEQSVWMVYAVTDQSQVVVTVSDRYGFGDGPKIVKTLDIQ